MKVFKALFATLGVFGVAGFLTWLENQGIFGLIILLAIMFLAIFFAMYCLINK